MLQNTKNYTRKTIVQNFEIQDFQKLRLIMLYRKQERTIITWKTITRNAKTDINKDAKKL